MATFLASPLLVHGKDVGDWHLHHFQDALLKSCMHLSKEQERLSATAQSVDDILMPERLCKGGLDYKVQMPNTISALLRIGNLLEESRHAQLPLQDYVKPFADLKRPLFRGNTFIIMDASLAEAQPELLEWAFKNMRDGQVCYIMH
jgi:hypothetical protein